MLFLYNQFIQECRRVHPPCTSPRPTGEERRGNSRNVRDYTVLYNLWLSCSVMNSALPQPPSFLIVTCKNKHMDDKSRREGARRGCSQGCLGAQRDFKQCVATLRTSCSAQGARRSVDFHVFSYVDCVNAVCYPT